MTERIAIITNVFDSAGVPGVDALVDEGYLTLCHASAFSDPAVRAAFDAKGTHRVAATAETPAALAREAIDRFGRIDVAISNDFAGVLQGPFVERTLEDYRALLENFTVSSFCLAAAVVPHMMERRSGRIIFMTSGAALKPSPGLVLYSAARAATHQMVRSLAVEVAPYGISVNAIAPAFFLSSFFPGGTDDPDLARLVKQHVPMQRHGRPEELAALIGLLASGRADYISGQIIAFSGAY